MLSMILLFPARNENLWGLQRESEVNDDKTLNDDDHCTAVELFVQNKKNHV